MTDNIAVQLDELERREQIERVMRDPQIRAARRQQQFEAAIAAEYEKQEAKRRERELQGVGDQLARGLDTDR